MDWLFRLEFPSPGVKDDMDIDQQQSFSISFGGYRNCYQSQLTVNCTDWNIKYPSIYIYL